MSQSKVDQKQEADKKQGKMVDLKDLLTPPAFSSGTNLNAIPKFNEHGDNIDPIIRKIPIQSIDEYAFNPRQADNDHFEAIKESIKEIGLQQRFSVVKNPKTERYTLIKGGNTRLLAFKSLYRETGDTKFASIDCIVEAWGGELNKTQAVIAHLVENEARGDLILVDKAKALIELEQEYKNNGIESLRTPQTKLENANISTTTQEFVTYLKDNGYSVSEGQLGLFRFTATKLTGNLDHFLNQGMGSPQIIKIRAVYNNIKRILKENDNDNTDGYFQAAIDETFSKTLKKYNKTKKPFDFDKLLDLLVIEFLVIEPFISVFDSNAKFKKELLSARRPKKKEQRKDIQEDVKAINTNSGGNDTDIDGENNVKHDDSIKPENDKDIDDQQTTQSEPLIPSIPVAEAKTIDDDAGTGNTNISEEQGQDGDGITGLDIYRKQAYDLVEKITSKLNLDNTAIKINHGCGFLLVDIVDESTNDNDFESWGVWWLLLGYSHAADLLNPIVDLRLLGLADIGLNQDLSALYVNTNLSDVEAVDSSLEKINQLSELYEFRSTNLQSVKDRLSPSLWQDITGLEAACYQIMRLSLNENTRLWE